MVIVNIFRVGVILLISMPLHGIGQNRAQALTDLKSLLHSEKEWIKVHAAEFLLWENQAVDEVREVYLQEERLFGDVPKYRIGIWRVLAQAAVDPQNRKHWVDKIVAAYLDTAGEDRLHAIETLAKLKVPIVHGMEDSLTGSMRIYSLWNYATASKKHEQMVKDSLLADLLSGRLSEIEILVTSFVLRYLGPFSKDEHQQLYNWLHGHAFNASVTSNLLATVWIAAPQDADTELLQKTKENLFALKDQPVALNNMMQALAFKGGATEMELIRSLYNDVRDANLPDYNSDLHATAAYMIMKTAGRRGGQTDILHL